MVTSFEKRQGCLGSTLFSWSRCFPRVKFLLHAFGDLANSTGTSGCTDRLGDQVKTCALVNQGIG